MSDEKRMVTPPDKLHRFYAWMFPGACLASCGFVGAPVEFKTNENTKVGCELCLAVTGPDAKPLGE